MQRETTSEILLLWTPFICQTNPLGGAGGDVVVIGAGVFINGRYQQIQDDKEKPFEAIVAWERRILQSSRMVIRTLLTGEYTVRE